MSKTKIEWAEKVWNPIRGCSRVSEGCRNCYAERQAVRFSGEGLPYHGYAEKTSSGPRWTGKVKLIREMLDKPLRWRKPARIFVNSMSDLFYESLSFGEIAAVFGVMAACPQHTFQVLTKRAQRMREWFRWVDEPESGKVQAAALVALRGDVRLHQSDGHRWPLPNVWLGVSAEDQSTADERIPHLLQCPAAVRWVSAEPLLGSIDMAGPLGLEWEQCDACCERYPDVYWGNDNQWKTVIGDTFAGLRCPDCFKSAVKASGEEPRLEIIRSPLSRLDWVVVGGESGHGARPCNVEWIRSIRDQCKEVGVACFVKQLGANSGWDYTAGTGRHREEVWIDSDLSSRKGGIMDEWPEDLRVRQYPETI